jgi:hypothetical protein
MQKTQSSRFFLGAVMAATLSLVGLAACSDNSVPVSTVLTGDHCTDACNRYAACFNASFDTATCASRCETAIANATITVQTSDDCLTCIGPNTCSGATYTCANVCGAFIIVP